MGKSQLIVDPLDVEQASALQVWLPNDSWVTIQSHPNNSYIKAAIQIMAIHSANKGVLLLSFCFCLDAPSIFMSHWRLFLSSLTFLPLFTWEHPSLSLALFVSSHTLPFCHYAILSRLSPCRFLSLSPFISLILHLGLSLRLSLLTPPSIKLSPSNDPLFFPLLLSLSSLIIRKGRTALVELISALKCRLGRHSRLAAAGIAFLWVLLLLCQSCYSGLQTDSLIE